MGLNQLNGTTDSSVMKHTKNINTETHYSYGLFTYSFEQNTQK